MRTLKKVLTLALACVMALSVFTACGSSSSGGSSNSFIDALNEELEPTGISVERDSKLDEKAQKLVPIFKAYAEEKGIDNFYDLYESLHYEMNEAESKALMAKAGLEEDSESCELLYSVATYNTVGFAAEIAEAKIEGYALVKAIGYTDTELLGTKCKLVVISYELLENAE